MADFFISYTAADESWAEWIGHVLEEGGFTTILQKWDFRPGSNFVLEMQRAAKDADRTLMVLSPDYMQSQFASSEWASAFTTDPQGLEQALVPIVVRECVVEGLLKSIVHINLIGLEEEEAQKCLLAGIRTERAKPAKRPAFPGAMAPAKFPGHQAPAAAQKPLTYIPQIKKQATDADRRRFVKHAFDTIRTHFETGLGRLAQEVPGLECDFTANTATDFAVEIFRNGKSSAACRIWLGGMMSSDSISYGEGRISLGNNSCNEILSVNREPGDLSLRSLMGSGFGFGRGQEDIKRLSPEEAADYLWRRFVSHLER